MWLKLCLLLTYLFLLVILSRVLEAIAWCEFGYSGALSRQFLDPMVLSVAKLKALLEQRGVSYEGVVEKSELTSLVDASGQVSSEEAEMAQIDEAASSDTNFTSGAHFIEQVEDAKDSVWLVQVMSHSGQHRILNDARWKTIRRKASKFGVRTGLLDCTFDVRYCYQKNWHNPFLLLALPSQFEKKANVAMFNYSGPVRETAVLRWVRDKLDERVVRIKSPAVFQQEWQNFSSNLLEPEIHAVLLTESGSAPVFYSALSVKFPGRVKFGLVCLQPRKSNTSEWKSVLRKENIKHLPAYIIYSADRNYTYGMRTGELHSFAHMEQFFKFLYPCLNDIFIISFCLVNVMSWFELFITNGSIFKRVRKFIWAMFKYNIVVIMLWLPIIGIFQMPYLDRVPLLALKMERIFSTSEVGSVLRGDYIFYTHHPFYVYSTFVMYLILITVLGKKYREEEQEDDDWFNFSHMRTLTYLRPNDFFEPMRLSGYDLMGMGRLEVFGNHLSQPSIWLQPSISPDYIQHLPTWRYCPVPLAVRAAENAKKMESALGNASNVCSCKKFGFNGANQSESSKPCLSSFHHDLSSNQTEMNQVTGHCHAMASNPSTVENPTANDWLPQGASASTNASAGQHIENQRENLSCPGHQRAMQHPHKTVYHNQCENDPTVSSTKTCGILNKTKQPNKSTNESLSVLSESDFAGANNSSQSTTSFASASSESSLTDTTRSSLNSTNSAGSHSTSSSHSGFPQGYLESQQCVICLDEYTQLTMLCGLPCGHVFHETCIISWLNRDKHFCPMCRWPSYNLPPTQQS